MSERPIESSGNPRGRRRPTRFRAAVETLDARRLMAAGLTGVVSAISGSAGFPLPVHGPLVEPPFGTLGALYPLEPVGTPVPLVTLTGSSTGPLSSTGHSGTVDWGDGSATDAALFGTFTPPGLIPQPANTLFVDGPDHTYQTPGNYPITVSVMGPGDSAPTAYHTTAYIALRVTAQLNPASDSGVSNTDFITSVNTPNFFGTTEPGAMVLLYAQDALHQVSAISVGFAVADAMGHWSITTSPLPDGSYNFIVGAADKQFNTGGTSIGQSVFPNKPLSIDTAGPKITSFQVTNARKGTFQVGFSDPYGLALAPIFDLNNYAVNRPSPTPRRGQKFPVASLTSPGVHPGDLLSDAPVLVTGTIGTGKPLANGVYTFTIHAAGITSLSGVSLDGHYTGKFPTGNGASGSDFQVRFTVSNGKASGPIAIAPAKATPRPVKAKVVVAKHYA